MLLPNRSLFAEQLACVISGQQQSEIICEKDHRFMANSVARAQLATGRACHWCCLIAWVVRIFCLDGISIDTPRHTHQGAVFCSRERDVVSIRKERVFRAFFLFPERRNLVRPKQATIVVASPRRNMATRTSRGEQL